MPNTETTFPADSAPGRALTLLKDEQYIAAAATMARHVRRHACTPHEKCIAAFSFAGAAHEDVDKPAKRYRQLRLLKRAIELDPEHPDHRFNLAAYYLNLSEAAKAVPHLEYACSKRPNHVRYRTHLGRALMETGRFTEAMPHCADAWEADKKSHETLTNLARCLGGMGRPDAAIQLYHQAACEHSNMRPIVEVFCFAMLGVCENPYQILQVHEQYSQSIEQNIPRMDLPAPRPRAGRKLNIGFMSSDFRQHSCRYFLLPLVRSLPRDRCTVTCVTTHPLSDEITPLFKALADQWVDVSMEHFKPASKLIADAGVDILIDCNGLTAGNRNDIMAHHPAPITATYLGYPFSTGSSRTDFRIVDVNTDPEPAADTHSSEQLIRLPLMWTYDPPENLPELGDAPRHRNGYTTYGIFNGAGKYSKSVTAWWAHVLNSDPTSRLVIKNSAFNDQGSLDIFRGSLQLLGIDPARVTHIPYTADVASHLPHYRSIDFQLDTFPYNGTTTTAESLVMGVPVITRTDGLHHTARTTLSLNHAAGLTTNDETASITPNELRRRVLDGPLCNHAAFATGFLDALEREWDRKFG